MGCLFLVGGPGLGRAAEEHWHCHSWVKVGCMLSRFQAAPFQIRRGQCFGQSTLRHEQTRVFWKKFAKLWENCLSKSGTHKCFLWVSCTF